MDEETKDRPFYEVAAEMEEVLGTAGTPAVGTEKMLDNAMMERIRRSHDSQDVTVLTEPVNYAKVGNGPLDVYKEAMNQVMGALSIPAELMKDGQPPKVLAATEETGQLFRQGIELRKDMRLEERLKIGALSDDVRNMKMGDELIKEGRMLKRVRGGLDMHNIMNACMAMGFGTRMPRDKDGNRYFTNEKAKYQKSWRKVLHVEVPDSEFYDCHARDAEDFGPYRGIPADAAPEPVTIEVKAEVIDPIRPGWKGEPPKLLEVPHDDVWPKDDKQEVVNGNESNEEGRKRLGPGADGP